MANNRLWIVARLDGKPIARSLIGKRFAAPAWEPFDGVHQSLTDFWKKVEAAYAVGAECEIGLETEAGPVGTLGVDGFTLGANVVDACLGVSDPARKKEPVILQRFVGTFTACPPHCVGGRPVPQNVIEAAPQLTGVIAASWWQTEGDDRARRRAKVTLPQALYDAAQKAGVDMTGYIRQKPLPKMPPFG